MAAEPDAKEAAAASPLLDRVRSWDQQFSVFKGLGLVTVAASLAGGYLQYLNTYEQKVSELAQADLAAATSAFVDISNAYAEVEMLQQLIYFNYAASNSSDAGNKAMTRPERMLIRITSTPGTRCARTATSTPARRSSISTGRAISTATPPAPRPSTAIR